jgi:hypothetical protein
MENNPFHEAIMEMSRVASPSGADFEAVMQATAEAGEETCRAALVADLQDLCATREWGHLITTALASAVVFGKRRFSAVMGELAVAGQEAGSVKVVVIIAEKDAVVSVDGEMVPMVDEEGA